MTFIMAKNTHDNFFKKVLSSKIMDNHYTWWLCRFEVFFKMKKIVKTCIIIIFLWVFLNNLYSLNSFQVFSHVTIRYFKHFHLNTLQTYNLSINFETKIEKSNIHYNIMCHCTTNDFIGFWINSLVLENRT